MDFVYASCSLKTDFPCFSSYEVDSFQPHWCRECVIHSHSKHQRKVLGLVWGKFSDVISWRPWMVGDWSLLPKMSVGGPVLGEGTVRGVFWAERDCKSAKLFPPEMALKHHHSIQVSSGTSLKFPGFSYVTTSSSEITWLYSKTLIIWIQNCLFYSVLPLIE